MAVVESKADCAAGAGPAAVRVVVWAAVRVAVVESKADCAAGAEAGVAGCAAEATGGAARRSAAAGGQAGGTEAWAVA
ncbi:hypothetical protein GCM10020256_48860 [Streptomyces thermocoprophilus]